MKLKQIALAFTALSLMSGAAMAQRITDLPQVAGKDYEAVPSKGSNSLLPQKVEGKPLVVDVFNYGCSHCYNIAEPLHNLIKSYGDKITYVKVPAPFGQWKVYNQIFYALDSMGIEKELSMQVFNLIHKERKMNLNLGSKDLNAFLTKNNIDKNAFEKAFNSPATLKKIEDSQLILQHYNVTSTPTLVLNNEKKFHPALNKGYAETIKALDKGIKIELAIEAKKQADKAASASVVTTETAKEVKKEVKK